MSFILDRFLGTLVNFAAVLVAGLLGVLIKKSVPKRITDSIMAAMAICVVYIGLDGALAENPVLPESALISTGLFKLLVMLISMALGTAIGELINIEKWVGHLGELLERKFSSEDERGSFSKGFIGCSLLFCTGAMTVNGAIADASGEPDILLVKAVLDAVACFLMASSLGIGCVFSAFFVLIYQGALTLGACLLITVMPASAVTLMSCVGSLIIVLVGTNVLGVTKVKTANMMPAMLIAPLVEYLIRTTIL